MSMTIKELADQLGVSKTAVRKYMDEDFRRKHTATSRNGVITIDSAGCALIAGFMGKQWDEAGTSENKIPESGVTFENMTIPRAVWDFMEDRIKHLESELAEERKHSRGLADELAKLADQAQQLHAGEMQQQRLEAGMPQTDAAIDADPGELEQTQPAPEPKKRRQGFLSWLMGG